jgi:ankyrin repeat protein
MPTRNCGLLCTKVFFKAFLRLFKQKKLTQSFVACFKGFTDLVAELLNFGADPLLAETTSRATPMHVATQEGHLEIVQLLLPHMENINPRTIGGYTPLVKGKHS